jgi:uncharacterized NAD(P)/FAD-binding protein YdhS
VIGLLDRLARTPPRSSPIDIVVVDRLGAFGGGVPYGPAVDPSFLLIEPVATSTPPEFHEWLFRRRFELIERSHRDPALRSWIAANEERLREARYQDLFVPRRFFGLFAAERLDAGIRAAAASGQARVRLVEGEVIDVETPEAGGYRVLLKRGSTWNAARIVVAMGCIPRPNTFGLSETDGYFHDLYRDASGFRSLRRAVEAHPSTEGLDVLIIGSNASAIEAVYFLVQNPALATRVKTLRLVSRSGSLPGSSAAQPSAREYLETLQAAASRGRLFAVAAAVRDVIRADGRLRVLAQNESGPLSFDADLVINGSGAGLMGHTSAEALCRMAAPTRRFRRNSCGRGFEMEPGSYAVAGLDDCYIAGPLLNLDDSATHVESIGAVWRVSDAIAEALFTKVAEAPRVEGLDDDIVAAAAPGLHTQ